MKKRLHRFEHAVLRTLRGGRLVARGERVLVAVSGGADSTALLHALHAIAPVLELSLSVAHLDHALRGAESAADAEFVRGVAARLGIAARVERRRIVRRRGESLETAARRVRYAFLAEAARESGCAVIATGHTANDQAETVLLRLLRGAGSAGLSGVRPQRPLESGAAVRVVRPLIDRRRDDVVRYLAALGAAHREDASNRSAEPLRNRVRMEILPRIATLVNPDAVSALARFARHQRAIDLFLAKEAAIALDRAVVGERRGEIALAVAALAAIDPAVAPYVLRLAVLRVARRTAGPPALDAAHIEALLALAAGPAGRRAAALPGSLVARRAGDRLEIARSEPARAPFCFPLPIPGSVALADAALSAARVPLKGAGPSHAPGSPYGPRHPFAVEFDLEWIAPPLEVRSRRAGDRIAPRGMFGRKSIQDLFVDRKIPWTERNRVPVVADRDRVLWVVGHAVSREAAISETTRETLVLAIEPSARGESNR